jgi:hypothetical protein
MTCLLALAGFTTVSAYTIQLRPGQWKLRPTAFRIDTVLDERLQKTDAGQVLKNGKSEREDFRQSLESDVLEMIRQSMQSDPDAYPIILSFQRLSFSETGTLFKHRLVLDYSIKYFSRINSVMYELFEVSGKP